jgi:hypothetical protein
LNGDLVQLHAFLFLASSGAADQGLAKAAASGAIAGASTDKTVNGSSQSRW